jgi:hypothetical protein
MKAAESREASLKMSNQGLERSRSFSWNTHVAQIISIAETLIREKAFGTS